MGRLPKDLEEKRLRLMGAVRRGAFESYVRHGRVPDMYQHIVAVVSEAKAVNTDVSLEALKPAARPAGRPTTHYVWRTAGDNRVRGSHSARNGQIFAWANPPEHGHPGQEPNCRCWPEPYYGDPAVPDTLLTMVSERRVNTDPGVFWASIDTTTRPDGSLAASNVVLNDGATIQSTFTGSTVTNEITMQMGDTVYVENRNGINTIRLGRGSTPLLQSEWTAVGPTVTRTRRRLAFLMDDPMGPDLYFEPIQTDVLPNPILDPNPMGSVFGLDNLDGPGIGAALLLLYLMRQAEPTAMGAGEQDAAYVAFRAWTNGEGPDGKVIPVPIAVGSVTEEQARESCKLLPDVQAWTDGAALTLAMDGVARTGQNYGMALHNLVKADVDARKRQLPVIYRGVTAEFSIAPDGEDGRYGEKGTLRFDVIERIPPDTPSLICDYEIKTGGAQLGGKQLADYMARLAAAYPGATIFMFQIKPTANPAR